MNNNISKLFYISSDGKALSRFPRYVCIDSAYALKAVTEYMEVDISSGKSISEHMRNNFIDYKA